MADSQLHGQTTPQEITALFAGNNLANWPARLNLGIRPAEPKQMVASMGLSGTRPSPPDGATIGPYWPEPEPEPIANEWGRIAAYGARALY